MPAHMPEQKRQDIREAIEAGWKISDIMRLLDTSAGSITNIKREMGIPIRPMQRNRIQGPVRTVAQPSWGGRNYDIAGAYIESLDAENPEPSAPLTPTIPRPEAYVTAFENRVLEYHELLRQYEQTLSERDDTIERLKKELGKLRDEYAQTVFRQQNWTGPTSVVRQSLGNGG